MSGSCSVGYLSGNTLIPYPFEDGQALAWADHGDEAQAALQRCFADALVYVDDDGAWDGVSWPEAADFSVSGQTLSFAVSYKGESREVSVGAGSGEEFPTVNGTAPWGRYLLILSSSGIADFCSSGFVPPVSGNPSSPGRAGLRFCPRCVTFACSGLRSIMVYDGVKDRSNGPHFTLKGDIRVLPGNNMLLEGSEGGFTLNAVPGAGMGTIPCTEECVVPVSDALSSPDGHVRLFNDTCYDLEPIYHGSGRASLVIHAKCTACCTCDMFESIVNDRLVPLFEAVRAAKEDLGGMLDQYESAVGRFNARLSAPRLSDVRLTLSGASASRNLGTNLSGTGISGRMYRCAFVATFSNSSHFTVNVTVNSISGNGDVAEASASWYDGSESRSASGDRASDMYRSYSLSPGASLVVSFVIVKSDLATSAKATAGFSGSISAGVRWRGGSLGVLSENVSV